MVKVKVKHIVIGLIIMVAVIGAIQTRSIFRKSQDVTNSNDCGISLTNKNRVFKAQTPSSFHGDGVSYQVYHFERKDMDLIVDDIKKNNNWLSCPFDNVTADLIKKKINYNTEYIDLLKESNYKVPIPSIENGYYLFVNRNDYNDGYYSNFNLYVLDIDTGLLYFITYDS